MKPQRPTETQKSEARENAIYWAQTVIHNSTNVLYLDTETDGVLDENGEGDAEILQIAIVTPTGRTLFNSMVKPAKPIEQCLESDAYQIHGIGAMELMHAPSFHEIAPLVANILYGKRVVIYNKAFDDAMLRREFDRTGIELPDYSAECAMIAYAMYKGVWNSKFGNWKWPKLPLANVSLTSHDAAVDCLSTIAVVEKMAQVADIKEISLDF